MPPYRKGGDMPYIATFASLCLVAACTRIHVRSRKARREREERYARAHARARERARLME